MSVSDEHPAFHSSRHDSTEARVVLIVDDDPDCRSLIREAVEEAEARRKTDRRHLEIYEVSAGEAAIACLKRQGEFARMRRPGLIYMDVEMPGMGGLEAVRRIKADPGLRDIPIVMLSGLSDSAAIEQAASHGANSYTVKPTDAERLLEAVLTSTDYWLHVHQTPQRHAPQEQCRR